MAFSIYDRRRIRLVAVISLLIGTIVWVAGRTDTKATDTSVASTTTTTVFKSQLQPITGDPTEPAYIDGPKSSIPDATNPIAYGAGVGANRKSGTAVFHRFSDDTRGKCHTEAVPLGVTITITNVNTGRSATCFNVAYIPPPVGVLITLNTLNYLLIGELADAPLPVEISW